jgi:DNA-binding NtrC family response regulator
LAALTTLAAISSASSSSILLVEDKDSLRVMLRHALEGQGHTVVEARDQPEALACLAEARPSLVLSDLRLPAGNGLGVLQAAKDLDADLPVIVMTAYGGVEDAVAAVKHGALDFLAKPVDLDHLLLLVSRALAQRSLALENQLLREELGRRHGAPTIIGESQPLKQVSSAIQRAAGTDTTVLLEGESGTGKELFARTLHALSGRASGPFVAVNCAAIPETLLEAELFGYERGAFTGATQRKLGKLEVAHRGTFFLDEIGEMPIGLQGKILRAIEERTFDRLGSTGSVKVDVRIVAATNRNLRQAVAARQFREDLYFRLSVFPIRIPPLRDRFEDVPPLARFIVERVAHDVGKRTPSLDETTLDALMSYRWPGNVRELQNCLERAVLLADGDTLLPRHLNLPAPATAIPPDPWASIDLSGSLDEATARVVNEVERRKIREALVRSHQDVGRAADLLKIDYRTLAAKMKALGKLE